MSTHHGFIKEFDYIRVDAFNGDAAKLNPFPPYLEPEFYLLTHAHTDHITGLDSPSFSGTIYCTAITRHTILETMEAGERVRLSESPGLPPVRKFANLRKKDRLSGITQGSRMKVIELNVPFKIESTRGDCIITAIDANHCPGSCMFLIESIPSSTTVDRKAVLVTGDIRAEPWWVESLTHNPVLSKYIRLGIPDFDSSSKGKGKEENANELLDKFPRLDCIYLDTSSVLVDNELPTKREAVEGLIKLIRRFPLDTKFFLNCWTTGYEDILKGISLAFNEKIHLDEYKFKMFNNFNDPLLSQLGTLNSNSNPVRFHACERRWKCDQVWEKGHGCFEYSEEDLLDLTSSKKYKKVGQGSIKGERKIIYVNLSTMSIDRWKKYEEKVHSHFDLYLEEDQKRMKGNLKRSAKEIDSMLPDFLMAPLSRHSSLPELQNFVSIFRPQTLYPLTMKDSKSDIQSLESYPCKSYRALSKLFGHLLAIGGKEQLEKESKVYTNLKLKQFGKKGRKVLPEDLNDFELFSKCQNPPELMWDNLEGGMAVTLLINRWANEDAFEGLPLLSPKRKKQKLNEESISTLDGISRTIIFPLTNDTDKAVPSVKYSVTKTVVLPPTSTINSIFKPNNSLLPSQPINSTSNPLVEQVEEEERPLSPLRRTKQNSLSPSSTLSTLNTSSSLSLSQENISPKRKSSRKSVTSAHPITFTTSPFSSSFTKPPSQSQLSSQCSPELGIPSSSSSSLSIPASVTLPLIPIRSPSLQSSTTPQMQIESKINSTRGVITTRPTLDSKKQREDWEKAFKNYGVPSNDRSLFGDSFQ